MPEFNNLDDFAAAIRVSHPDMVDESEDDRPREARGHWTPLLQRVYGIKPWEIGGYSVREYNALIDDLNEYGLG